MAQGLQTKVVEDDQAGFTQAVEPLDNGLTFRTPTPNDAGLGLGRFVRSTD